MKRMGLMPGAIAGGRVTVFREPDEHGAYYSLGFDSAYGLEDGDYDAAVMLRQDGEQVLTAHGKWGSEFADILWPILQWYKPFVVGEKQVGLPILRQLWDRGYLWLYFNLDQSARGRPQKDTLGHVATRNDISLLMLQAAIGPRDEQGELKEPQIRVRDEELHTQLVKFQFLPRSQAKTLEECRDSDLVMSAPPGEHDDLVRALALSELGRQRLGQYPRPATEKFLPGTAGAVLGHAAILSPPKKAKDPFGV